MAKRAGRTGKIKLTVRYSVLMVLVLGFLTLTVLNSLFRTIAAGLILSYIFYPVYRAAYGLLKFRTVSALFVTILVVVLLIVPSFFVVNKLTTEVSVGFVVAKQYIEGGTRAIKCEGDALCQLIPKNLRDIDPKIKALLTNSLGKGTEFILGRSTQLLLSLPSMLLTLFIVFFTMYYMLKDGDRLIERIKSGIPLKKHRQDALVAQFSSVASAVVYGTVVVAILQGILAGIGFFLFGVPSPVVWGLVTLLASLVPFLGPFVVWLPIALLLVFSGHYSGDGLMLLRGIGLLLYGTLVVSGIDNVLKPRIIGKKANVHPALVLLGIMGGMNLFGIVGIVLGPVIVAVFVTAYDAYVQEKAQIMKAEQQ